MRLYVLASPGTWHLADLCRAALGRHEITPVSFRELASGVRSGGTVLSAGGHALSEADAVLVRTMPPGSLEQIVFRMDVLGRLAVSGTPVVNPPRALEAAVDKYLALARLHEAGLLVPETIVCQTLDDAMRAFEALGGDVVLKPLFGSEGRGITRLTDEALALRAFQTLISLRAVLYIQRFIPHDGHDLRVLCIGSRVLAIKRSSHADWRTNVARGAVAEPVGLTPALEAAALRAAAAIGAPVAGIDFLPGGDGRLYCLEVNAVPGWKALAAAHGIDVAEIVLDYVQNAVG